MKADRSRVLNHQQAGRHPRVAVEEAVAVEAAEAQRQMPALLVRAPREQVRLAAVEVAQLQVVRPRAQPQQQAVAEAQARPAPVHKPGAAAVRVRPMNSQAVVVDAAAAAVVVDVNPRFRSPETRSREAAAGVRRTYRWAPASSTSSGMRS